MSHQHGAEDDSTRAIRFLIMKAAIFIGIPVAASAAAVLLMLK